VTGVGVDFVSADDGWLLVNSGEGFGQYTALYRTTDGGATWAGLLSAQSWYSGPGKSGTWAGLDLSFASTNDGWLLAGMGPGAGSEPKELLATTDGGTTWHLVASPSALPLPTGTDQSVMMVFTSATKGFITASNTNAQTSPPTAFLFETSDGGRSWHQVALPRLPASKEAWRFNTVDSFAFSSAEAGEVVFTYSDVNNDQATYCYSTPDGGTSWSLSTCRP